MSIRDLFHLHECMLEYQACTSMVLSKVAMELTPQMYLTVIKVSVKATHQITLPEEVQVKLKASPKNLKLTRNKRIVKRISPDPEGMKDWGEDSATLYLAATYTYYIQKAICGTSNMVIMFKKFRVKLTALRRCINSCRYKGGSSASKKRPVHQSNHQLSRSRNSFDKIHLNHISSHQLCTSPVWHSISYSSTIQPVPVIGSIQDRNLSPLLCVTSHSCFPSLLIVPNHDCTGVYPVSIIGRAHNPHTFQFSFPIEAFVYPPALFQI